MEKEGVKEFKDVVRFGLKLGQALQGALEDGSINIMDALKFLPVLKELQSAVQGANKIPAELKDLDEKEKDELVAYFQKEFDLPNDAMEHMIEMSVQVGFSLLQLGLGFVKK